MTEQMTSPVGLEEDVEKFIRDRVDAEVRSIVAQEVVKEEERRFRQLKWLVGLVGLVGLGTFGTLSNYLIEKAVDSRLESRTGNISESLDFVRFSSITLKLELGTSFSKEDKEPVMSYLRRASKNERVRHSPEFMAALHQVTKAFVSAGQSASIDEIFLHFERETLSSNGLVENLLHHYGQQLVSRPIDPKLDTAVSTFEKLEGVAPGAHVPELALCYRALFTYRQDPKTQLEAVNILIGRAAMLDPSDGARFFNEILQRTKVSNWQRRADLEGRTFEAVTRGFLFTYADTISRDYGVDRNLILDAAKNGVDADASEALANKIVSSRKES